jgi:hypothetical protein
MDYRGLFGDVSRRPNSYGLDGSYGQAVAFVMGCDAGNEWGLLCGFREWLAMRIGYGANMAWPFLIREIHVAADPGAGEEVITDVMFRLLDEFLQERSRGRGATDILIRYATWSAEEQGTAES